MIKIVGIKCPKCLDVIYSRARHDYHHCSCGTNEDGTEDSGISIDGGFDYLRYGWSNDIKLSDIEIVEVEVNATKQELYDDWNTRQNKYGVIRNRNPGFMNKEDILEDWFWDKIISSVDYELFLQIYSDTSNRMYMIEQMFGEEHYGI